MTLHKYKQTLQNISMPYEFSPRLVAPPTFSTRVITPRGTSKINGGSWKNVLTWAIVINKLTKQILYCTDWDWHNLHFVDSEVEAQVIRYKWDINTA